MSNKLDSMGVKIKRQTKKVGVEKYEGGEGTLKGVLGKMWVKIIKAHCVKFLQKLTKTLLKQTKT